MGSSLMNVWMGPRYESGLVMTIIVCGFFLPMTQLSAKTILVGVNAHGRIALFNLALSIMTLGIGSTVLGIVGWSLVGASLLVASFVTINGISVLLYSCRRFDISLASYVRRSFLGP